MLILTKSLFALMIGLISSAAFGLMIIPFLKKLKFRQRINIYVEQHRQKAGTPTMGGSIFIVPTLLITFILLIMGKMHLSVNLIIVLFVFISYSLIGLIDDYISISKNRNAGLTVKEKLVLQAIIALVVYILFRHFGSGDSVIRITFLNIELSLGWFYGLFIMIMLVGFSNAVNLTDGLDGLSGGLSGISFFAFGLIAMGSTWVIGYQDLSIFCFLLTGSILGFLLYNGHPAKVIMGDMGSLSLGATLAVISLITSHELLLFLIGGIFIVETLSVIIQVSYFSFTRKRVFLMAPLHHHFERLGWSETDIVKLFWAIGFILALLALIYGVWL